MIKTLFKGFRKQPTEIKRGFANVTIKETGMTTHGHIVFIAKDCIHFIPDNHPSVLFLNPEMVTIKYCRR